jgi:hypothetical protein
VATFGGRPDATACAAAQDEAQLEGLNRDAEEAMMKWIYLTVLALALLTLAVGGWIAKGFKSVTRPSGRVVPKTA